MVSRAAGYDVIPDLHADPDRLERSLAALGPGGRPAFLGDFIDGKPGEAADDAAVLGRVRGLVEAGAPAVMGNHELNAVLFHRVEEGRPLRPRHARNRAQHASFLSRFPDGPGPEGAAARGWTDWFLTLPLWRDLGGLRLVHACWDEAAIATVAARRPDARLRLGDLAEVAREDTAFGRAVNRLLTGPEIALPEGQGFTDHVGHRRHHMRFAWWTGSGSTWREAAISVPRPSELPAGPLPPGAADGLYPAGAPPVLFGHYKMVGAPRIEAPNAACIDYPAAPCLYRWRGEARLDPDRLLRV